MTPDAANHSGILRLLLTSLAVITSMRSPHLYPSRINTLVF
jgi:hypothetical protein